MEKELRKYLPDAIINYVLMDYLLPTELLADCMVELLDNIEVTKMNSGSASFPPSGFTITHRTIYGHITTWHFIYPWEYTGGLPTRWMLKYTGRDPEYPVLLQIIKLKQPNSVKCPNYYDDYSDSYLDRVIKAKPHTRSLIGHKKRKILKKQFAKRQCEKVKDKNSCCIIG